MRQATIAQIKARLSEFVAAVKAGETVVVTERGRPVARLTPLEETMELEARAAALVRSGVLVEPRGRLAAADFLAAERPADPAGELLAAVLAERDEGP